MLYIKIDDEKYPAKFHTFQTQMGNEGIRVTSDAPTAEGFLIVNEDDEIVFDRSDFTYLYREDENCKEYTAVEEEIIPTESSAIGDYPSDPIYAQLSALSQRVSDITPYTESKEAGIQDKECIFYGYHKDGVLTASVVTSKGEIKPCEIERSDDNITVRFEELKETATVTIQIQ